MPALKNLTGAIFGKWTVLEYAGPGSDGATWKCVCECGTSRVVISHSLLNGKSASCGCWQRERMAVTSRRHGHQSGGKQSPTYKSWRNMLNRCNNAKHPSYRNYGGKGIAVCETWTSFDVFLADMGVRPDGETLDRIKSDAGYSKENCRWCSMKEQANNRSNNHFLELNGERRTVAQWAEHLGIKVGTIAGRLHRGATDEQALRQ